MNLLPLNSLLPPAAKTESLRFRALASAGILLVMAGKPWFLAVGAVAFIVAFGRIGCLPKNPH